MKNNLYVFDTTTLVSALIFKNSTPAQAFKKALTWGKILLSTDVFSEISEVIHRDKFRRYFSVKKAEVFTLMLYEDAIFIDDISESITACRDPKDNKFLELAVAGKANLIVSSDKDLQVLHPFRRIPILSPAKFLDYQPIS